MTPEHWQSVKVALHEAIALTGDERLSYLEVVAARDPPLYVEVWSLLAAKRSNTDGNHVRRLYMGPCACFRRCRASRSEAARARDAWRPAVALDPAISGAAPAMARRCYRELGEYARATESYDQAIALYQSLHQPQSVALNMAYEGKALLLEREDRYAEAESLLRRAITGYANNAYVPDGPAIGVARIELARSLQASGQTIEARALAAAAEGIVERELTPAHPARKALLQLRALRRDSQAQAIPIARTR